ncbi:hypothetical protein BST33_11140 [Mycolicibacter minnesotensis]|uniref:(2E)-enoyl-[ACP] glycyltransferase n=1 Tax=Mycolicibacter minnesotensis TaxID=1118379 RepID=A0A7I7R3T5_9MYCO|nr:FcoT family thioesterase [Mycolicibacter minnesotensis]ORB00526.1 hypothetical protein BST33_11140 [Mycolicibacter minnesotensis]BBY33245.1 hypothetical protein MMIN_13060 [Mycolicibacter minnesotensis]
MSAGGPTLAALSNPAPIPENILEQVLEPYSYKGCRYLRDATVEVANGNVLAEGSFSIGESAYIRSTGHFNAVELVLAFNQLAYSAFGPVIGDGMLPFFDGWTFEDYLKHQLASMFIRTSSSRFRRPIDATNFFGRLHCTNLEVVERSVRYLRVPCAIEFWDEHGGSASGEFELAALNIPG